MRLLLDTCIFLWLISGDKRLDNSILEEICEPNNEIFLSSVSIWECVVKNQIGRLPLPEPPAEYLSEQRNRHNISSLPLDEGSIVHLSKLPLIHRDPFDRMLICQSIEHNLTIVTVDDTISSYPVIVMGAGS